MLGLLYLGITCGSSCLPFLFKWKCSSAKQQLACCSIYMPAEDGLPSLALNSLADAQQSSGARGYVAAIDSRNILTRLLKMLYADECVSDGKC